MFHVKHGIYVSRETFVFITYLAIISIRFEKAINVVQH